MSKPRPSIVTVCCLALVACGSGSRSSTDADLILRVNSLAPNGKFRLLEYQYDIGALGYSRTWWAVTPPVFEGLDLTKYELPYGYMAVGWSPASELLVESWKPYYYSDCTWAFRSFTIEVCKTPTLSSGDLFQGVRVVVTPHQSLGAPTGYAMETMRRQRMEIEALKRKYSVIEIPSRDQPCEPIP